jgi:hypothetical protein
MSSLGGPNIVTSGLVLHLDAANPKSYPGTGSIWYDRAANLNAGVANNGTLVNTPTFNSENGGGIIFDGVNEYVNCGSSLILDTSSKFSINIVFKLISYNNTYPTLFTIKTSVGNSLVMLLTQNITYSPLTFGWNGNFTYKPQSTTINPNIWYNFCLVYNGGGINNISSFKFYINGVSIALITSNTFAGISQANTLGTLNNGTSNYYLNGNISQASIYNIELSPQEVLQNYNATKSRYGL